MTPQNVMAYLRHGAEHKSLATVAQVGRLIASAEAPSMLVYVNTAKLFELVYPVATLALSSGMNVLGGGQNQFPPLEAIPSAPAIRRHLVPGTAALRRTKQGLELISRQPLPGNRIVLDRGSRHAKSAVAGGRDCGRGATQDCNESYRRHPGSAAGIGAAASARRSSRQAPRRQPLTHRELFTPAPLPPGMAAPVPTPAPGRLGSDTAPLPSGRIVRAIAPLPRHGRPQPAYLRLARE